MGIACGKEAHYRVSYGTRKIHFQGEFEELSDLKYFLASKFPELLHKSFNLHALAPKFGLIQNSADLVKVLHRAQGTVLLKVMMDAEPRLSSQLLENLSRGVVKLRHAQGSVEGTGIIVGSTYVLTTAEQLRHREALREYLIIPQDNTELKLKPTGTYLNLGNPPLFVLVELDINKDWFDDSVLIRLRNDTVMKSGIRATILYFNKHKPFLHELTQPITVLDNGFFRFSGEPLGDGSSGAPVFNEAGTLLGLYSAYWEGGIALSATALLDELLYNGSAESVQAVRDIAFHSSLYTLEFTENQADHSESESVYQKSLGPCYLDPDSHQLFQLEKKHLVSSRLHLPNGIGHQAIYTSKYTLILGEGEEHNKAWAVQTNGTVKELANMKFAHKYHCVAVSNRKVYVVSGKFTGAIESWDLKKSRWLEEGDFPKPLQDAAAAYFRKTLIVMGGRIGAKKKPSRRIYTLRDNVWEELSAKLPDRIFCHGLIPLTKQPKVLIFGGFTENDDGEWETRETILTLDLKRNAIEATGVCGGGIFSGLPSIKWQGDSWIYTTQGKCLQFIQASQTFEQIT